jgi:hypothetical protein
MTKAKKPAPKDQRLFMAFRPEPEMARAMHRLHARDGITMSEQIRRALQRFLKSKGVYAPKERP